MMNSMNFENVKIGLHPGVWGLKPSSGLPGPNRLPNL